MGPVGCKESNEAVPAILQALKIVKDGFHASDVID